MAKNTGLSRRSMLMGAAAAVGGAAVAPGVASADPATGAHQTAPVATGATIGPHDPRYAELRAGNNQRFVARPDYIRMITSPEDAERAVRDAVRTRKRIAVRGGGHCFSDFVCHDETKVILDVSEMTGVGYDADRRAFVVEAGARLINVYEALFKGWNVTIPGGICYGVGVGGHIAGGGYGLLSRAHGLTVDHLYAVEVVTVDRGGLVRTGDRHPRAGRPQPRPLVGTHRRRWRQLRGHHPLLVPLAGRHRLESVRPAGLAALDRADQRDRVPLGRAHGGILHAAASATSASGTSATPRPTRRTST